MKKILIILLLPLLSTSQSNFNLQLLGSYQWSFSEGSDIWGWVDSNGNEFALVGLNDGFSVVDVTNPMNLNEMFYIPDLNSTWRDIKTWGNYAYVTTEADAGLLIVDLSDMSGNTYWHKTNFTNPNGQSTEFTAAHNIYIDENGIAYIFGASSNSGSNPSNGAIFLDVAADPINPYYLGEWDQNYIHDGMVRGDTMYAGCIYAGELFIVDVSNKSNPQTLGSKSTPSNFTHNAWVSDDGDYVFTTDEVNGAFLGSYDITDLNNIQEVDRIQSNPGSNSAPHNTHVDGNFLITSYYQDGTTVHDITHPYNIIQVAYYDSYSGSGAGFNGCWGTYPFLPSGNIISSDINSINNSGVLFVYGRDFSQACYLEGNVTDALTNSPLNTANVKILNTIANSSSTNLLGNYNTGTPNSGFYNVEFSKNGYITDTFSVNLSNGIITVLDVSLSVDTSFEIVGCTNPNSLNYNPNANAVVAFGGALDNTFSTGGYFNGNQHLIFDAYDSFRIKSAMFYADNGNTITFELRDNSGTVIDDTTLNVSSGPQRLTLNFDVPAGNDHQLGIDGQNSGLYRNDSGANYPYDIGGLMSITRSSASSDPTGYYYFYYDIEIDVPCSNNTTSIHNEELFQNNDYKKLYYNILGKRISKPQKNQISFEFSKNGLVQKLFITE